MTIGPDDIRNLVIGLISGVVLSVLGYLLRRFWNPVRWRFSSATDSQRWLERVSGPTAFGITLASEFSSLPAFVSDIGDGVHIVPVGARLRFSDLRKGERDLTVYEPAYPTEFFLFWVERGRRRGAEVRIPAGATTHELRRRDVLSAKRTEAAAESRRLNARYERA